MKEETKVRTETLDAFLGAYDTSPETRRARRLVFAESLYRRGPELVEAGLELREYQVWLRRIRSVKATEGCLPFPVERRAGLHARGARAAAGDLLTGVLDVAAEAEEAGLLSNMLLDLRAALTKSGPLRFGQVLDETGAELGELLAEHAAVPWADWEATAAYLRGQDMTLRASEQGVEVVFGDEDLAPLHFSPTYPASPPVHGSDDFVAGGYLRDSPDPHTEIDGMQLRGLWATTVLAVQVALRAMDGHERRVRDEGVVATAGDAVLVGILIGALVVLAVSIGLSVYFCSEDDSGQKRSSGLCKLFSLLSVGVGVGLCAASGCQVVLKPKKGGGSGGGVPI